MQREEPELFPGKIRGSRVTRYQNLLFDCSCDRCVWRCVTTCYYDILSSPSKTEARAWNVKETEEGSSHSSLPVLRHHHTPLYCYCFTLIESAFLMMLSLLFFSFLCLPVLVMSLRTHVDRFLLSFPWHWLLSRSSSRQAITFLLSLCTFWKHFFPSLTLIESCFYSVRCDFYIYDLKKSFLAQDFWKGEKWTKKIEFSVLYFSRQEDRREEKIHVEKRRTRDRDSESGSMGIREECMLWWKNTYTSKSRHRVWYER